MLAAVGSSLEEGFIVSLSWGRCVYGLLPCLGTEMQSMGVKCSKHPGDGARRRCICQSALCFHPVVPGFPAAPRLQLPCVCGAIPVRGGLQKYSLQSRGLELALYLLWDRLWTRQTYSYFCWSPSCSAVLLCLSLWVCTLTREVLQYMSCLSLPLNWQISHPFHSTSVVFNCTSVHIWQWRLITDSRITCFLQNLFNVGTVFWNWNLGHWSR